MLAFERARQTLEPTGISLAARFMALCLCAFSCLAVSTAMRSNSADLTAFDSAAVSMAAFRITSTGLNLPPQQSRVRHGEWML